MKTFTYQSSQSFKTLTHWQSGQQKSAFDKMSLKDFILTNRQPNYLLSDDHTVMAPIMPIWEPTGIVQTSIRNNNYTFQKLQLDLTNKVFESKNTEDAGTFYNVIYDLGTLETYHKKLEPIKTGLTSYYLQLDMIYQIGKHDVSGLLSSYISRIDANVGDAIPTVKPTIHRYLIASAFMEKTQTAEPDEIVRTSESVSGFESYDVSTKVTDDNYISLVTSLADDALNSSVSFHEDGQLPEWLNNKQVEFTKGYNLCACSAYDVTVLDARPNKPAIAFGLTNSDFEPTGTETYSSTLEYYKHMNGIIDLSSGTWSHTLNKQLVAESPTADLSVTPLIVGAAGQETGGYIPPGVLTCTLHGYIYNYSIAHNTGGKSGQLAIQPSGLTFLPSFTSGGITYPAKYMLPYQYKLLTADDGTVLYFLVEYEIYIPEKFELVNEVII